MSPSSCEPIATCIYGWGRSARLYSDVLTLNGRLHELAELEAVQARYQRFLGISSARLTLRFKRKVAVLRGIANVAVARQMATYLETYVEERLPQTRALALAEEETPISEVELSPTQEKTHPLDPLPLLVQEKTHPLPEDDPAQFWEYGSSEAEVAASAITEAQPSIEALTEELAMSMAESGREEPSRWKRQRELQERRRLRLRRLREERVVREHGFDVLALALRLRTELLPVVDVPTNLLAGEVAHYRTEAMLCGEPLAGSSGRNRSRYRIKDQGILILTNRRLLYLGRQRQITLSHERLREVSRTLRTVSFLGDNWGRCQLFEVRRPLEVTMYLECILQCYASPMVNDANRNAPRIVPTTPASSWSQEHERKVLEQIKLAADALDVADVFSGK